MGSRSPLSPRAAGGEGQGEGGRTRPLGLLLLALTLVACTGSDDPTPEPDPLVYGGDRPVRLQLPSGLTSGTTHPLVLVLHGYGASGVLQQLYLGLTTSTLAGGIFVLAPDGLVDGAGRRFWHANDVCCDFGAARPDDVAYLGGLLDSVAAEWPVDTSRVLVVGHSNGAFMAYRLACDRADRVTAIAGLAGGATLQGCTPSAPVGVLHLHGTADDTVLYEGGAFPSGLYPGAEDSVAAWAALDGCTSTFTTGPDRDLASGHPGAETRTARADGCPPGVAVELWTLEGAGHVPALAPDFAAQVLSWLAALPGPPG